MQLYQSSPLHLSSAAPSFQSPPTSIDKRQQKRQSAKTTEEEKDQLWDNLQVHDGCKLWKYNALQIQQALIISHIDRVGKDNLSMAGMCEWHHHSSTLSASCHEILKNNFGLKQWHDFSQALRIPFGSRKSTSLSDHVCSFLMHFPFCYVRTSQTRKTRGSDSRGLDQKWLTSDILLGSERDLPCYRPHSCKNNMIWPSWNSKEGWPGREGGGGSIWGDPVIVLTASASSQLCPKHWLIFLPDLFKIGLTKQCF